MPRIGTTIRRVVRRSRGVFPEQQAARVSEDTGFFNLKGAGQPGRLVEFNPTKKVFSNPDHPDTEAYVSGRFG